MTSRQELIMKVSYFFMERVLVHIGKTLQRLAVGHDVLAGSGKLLLRSTLSVNVLHINVVILNFGCCVQVLLLTWANNLACG